LAFSPYDGRMNFSDTLVDAQEEEVTMGTGKVLGLFFGLTVVCALFFTFGYSVGRKSPPLAEAATVSEPSDSADVDKPSAAQAQAADMTFYQSVEQKEPQTTLAAVPEEKGAAAPEAAAPAPTVITPRVPAGFVVQVAALSKLEDAEAMVSVLRQKQYPVFIVGQSASDKYIRVQVGPFPDEKAAESMQARLSRDGYKAIVKK